MQKHFYITAELAEGIPSYNFVVKADTEDQARDIAREIIENDYPEYRSFTADQLAKSFGDQDHNGREAGFELLTLLTLN